MNNSKDYLLNLLKDKYDHEMHRKDGYESSLNIPMTILSALFAGLYFVGSDKQLTEGHCTLETLKWIFIGLLFLSCTTTLILLFRVYFGYRRSYCVFPDSKTVYETDYRALELYNKEHFLVKEDYEREMTESLKDHAIHWYVECNNQNTPVNNLRADAMFYARLFICISLSIGLALLIFVCIIKAI